MKTFQLGKWRMYRSEWLRIGISETTGLLRSRLCHNNQPHYTAQLKMLTSSVVYIKIFID